ncbi:hypothetical protein KJI95_06795 [Shewanella sp. JM162201]|uniref:Porin n=1 Tax=Shewanella jiangmenensis TaxID=2837387 RepID=A0ABS5V175_9GAMM|nr:hypothetical protein [Shewanella jiangmenensis]MBT1444232.1 hypothetical protein [Shewanella jiangmenensis]
MKKVVYLLFCQLLICAETSAGEVQLNAYLSQGAVMVEGSEFFTGDDDSSLKLSEATLTASWRALDALRFAGALGVRQRGNLTEEHIQADYLFAELMFPVAEGAIGVRLGRVKNEVGFYSSTRDVPFSRPGIFLPQSIYADYYRDAQLHINGGDVVGRHFVLDGQLEWHLSGGQLHVTEDLTQNSLGTTAAGQFDSDYFYAFDLDFRTDNLRLGASLYQSRLGYNPKSAVMPELAMGISVDTPQNLPGNIELFNYVLSAQYRWQQFELTAEYLRGVRTLSGMMAKDWEIEEPNRGFYIDSRWLVNDALDLFVRYDDAVDNLSDPGGDGLAVIGNPDYFGYSRDWSTGLQWRITPNWLLSAEYHHIEGASWVPPILTKDPLTQDKYWTLVAIQLAYRMQW